MRIEYEMPSVEIVDFTAIEKLASNRAAIEARDGKAGGDPSIDGASYKEGVGDWDE